MNEVDRQYERSLLQRQRGAKTITLDKQQRKKHYQNRRFVAPNTTNPYEKNT